MKMVLADVYKIPVAISLLVIAVVLAIAVVASLLRARHLNNQRGTAVQPTAVDQAWTAEV
jgi:tellurite resistance protein TerC